MVPPKDRENGQTEQDDEDEEEDEEVQESERKRSRLDDRTEISLDAGEKQGSFHDTEAKKGNWSASDEAVSVSFVSKLSFSPHPPLFLLLVTPSDSVTRRSVNQQKSGVSITIDDPVQVSKQPSPPRGKVSKIIHVRNLVRSHPFTQMRTGM